MEPYFHLRLGELQGAREAGALRAAQIAFHIERRFQLEDLSLGENCACFLFRDHFVLFVGDFVDRGDGTVVAAVPAIEARVRHLQSVFPTDDDGLRSSVTVSGGLRFMQSRVRILPPLNSAVLKAVIVIIVFAQSWVILSVGVTAVEVPAVVRFKVQDIVNGEFQWGSRAAWRVHLVHILPMASI